MITPVTVHADDSLNDAVNIMRERRVDTIFVVNNQNRLLGFLDIEDINQGLRRGEELIDMMQRDVYKVHINTKLQDSVRTILKRNVRNVPVVDDDNTLIGLITRANLVDIVYDSLWGDENDDAAPLDSDNKDKQSTSQQDAPPREQDVMNGLDHKTNEMGDDR